MGWPIKSRAAARAERAELHAGNRAGKENAGRMTKILIVDDSKDNITLTSLVLEKDDYTIISAENGREALRKAQIERPDVILLDIQMPELDGFEVCRRLKADEDTSSIPVLFLTAKHKDIDSMSLGLSLGAEDYIVKPFSSIELRARVSVLARLKRHMDELGPNSPVELHHTQRVHQDIRLQGEGLRPLETADRDLAEPGVEVRDREHHPAGVTRPRVDLGRPRPRSSLRGAALCVERQRIAAGGETQNDEQPEGNETRVIEPRVLTQNSGEQEVTDASERENPPGPKTEHA